MSMTTNVNRYNVTETYKSWCTFRESTFLKNQNPKNYKFISVQLSAQVLAVLNLKIMNVYIFEKYDIQNILLTKNI